MTGPPNDATVERRHRCRTRAPKEVTVARRDRHQTPSSHDANAIGQDHCRTHASLAVTAFGREQGEPRPPPEASPEASMATCARQVATPRRFFR